MRENEPGIHIARISPTPLLMIVAGADLLTASDLALHAYQQALPPKHLIMLPGGHFDPYLRHFERTSSEARTWFLTHLADAPIR